MHFLEKRLGYQESCTFRKDGIDPAIGTHRRVIRFIFPNNLLGVKNSHAIKATADLSFLQLPPIVRAKFMSMDEIDVFHIPSICVGLIGLMVEMRITSLYLAAKATLPADADAALRAG